MFRLRFLIHVVYLRLRGSIVRLVRILVVLALMIDLPPAFTAETQPDSAPQAPAREATHAGAKSDLLADCTETVVRPSPMPPRPVARHAALPSKPHRHHRKKTHRVVKRAHHKKPHAHHRHRPRKHRRPSAPKPPVFRHLSYASPLCDQPSPAMKAMLGLPEVTQPPVAAIEEAIPNVVLALSPVTDIGPVAVTGPVTPIIDFPPGPGLPPGPTGPIILPPIGPPPVPPIVPPAIPEPAGWATMLTGMMLIGRSLRRRRRALFTEGDARVG